MTCQRNVVCCLICWSILIFCEKRQFQVRHVCKYILMIEFLVGALWVKPSFKDFHNAIQVQSCKFSLLILFFIKHTDHNLKVALEK